MAPIREFNKVVAPAAGFDPNSTGLKPSAKRAKPFGLERSPWGRALRLGVKIAQIFSPKGFVLLAEGFSPVRGAAATLLNSDS